MPYDLAVYDDHFYQTYGHEAEKMSRWFLPLLNSVIPFNSLVDVGAGEGHYLKWLEDNRPEVKAIGLEGSPAVDRRMVTRMNPIIKIDLRTYGQAFRIAERFDIALSLEVAEHIEEEYSDTFIDALCSLSDVVVMTAASPGQGGLMHVNEQLRSYWEKKFFARGYGRDEAEIHLILGIVEARERGEYVTPWLQPNIVVFRNAA